MTVVVDAQGEKTGWTTITLKPGGTWVADQQRMTYYPGNYLADWVPMNKGDPWRNSAQYDVTFEVDYGEKA